MTELKPKPQELLCKDGGGSQLRYSASLWWQETSRAKRTTLLVLEVLESNSIVILHLREILFFLLNFRCVSSDKKLEVPT